MKYETKTRSVIKSITWRVVASLATLFTAYFLTSDISIAFSIGLIDVISKFILYYVHERAWSNILWGMK